MKPKTVLAFIGGAAIVGALAYKAIQVIIGNIKIVPGTPVLDTSIYNLLPAPGTTYNTMNLDVPIFIENKNPFPLAINNFFGSVYYGKIILTRVTLPNGIYVPANSSTTINLNLDIPIDAVINDVANAAGQGILNVLLNRIELVGSVRIGAKGYNLQYKLDRIPIPIA